MAEPTRPRFYVASSEPAGAVTSCACGNFFRPTERNLAVAKKDQLDIMGFASEGVKIIATTRTSSAISRILTIHPSWAKNDLLFVLMINYDVLMLELGTDGTHRPYIRTVAAGSVQDKVGRVTEQSNQVAVDPENRCIALHIYDSLVRIIPLKDTAEPKEIESFNMRVEECNIGSIVFLHNAARPTLALLHKDLYGTHISSYEVDFQEKELKPPKNKHVELKNLENDTISLCSVPGTNQGVIACGFNTLTFADVDGVGITAGVKKENRGLGIAYALLHDSPTGTKFLVGDLSGALHVIFLKKTPSEKSGHAQVVECGVISLGVLTITSCLAYLDNRVVFVGSRLSDSMIIRLRDDPNPETGNLFDVAETISNIGSITDFSLVRSDNQGTQPQMIVCSGMGPGSHARIVRSGIGMQETTSLDAPTGRQIFALNSQSAAFGPHDWLVASFLSETKVLRMENEVGEFEDLIDVGAFVLNDSTQLAAKVNGLIVQVTKKSIRIIVPGELTLKEEWFPSDRSHQITSAAFHNNQVVAAAFDTLLIVDLASNSTGSRFKEIKLDDQISAVDIHSFTPGEAAEYIVVATWKMDLVLLSAPEWKRSATVDLNTDVFARSVMLQELDGVDYVIAGLGDGSLQYFVLDKIKGKVNQPKRVSVGTQPTYLQSFVARGTTNIFVCNDRPSVIHSSGRKLVFSNVNMKHVYAVCQLNSSVYPNNLAIITETGLVVGKMDEIQKLHIRSISLPGTPRRVACQPETGTCGFIVMQNPMEFDVDAAGDSEMIEEPEEPPAKFGQMPAQKFLVTDQTNYQILATFPLLPDETSMALASGNLGNDPRTFYIVGTGISKKDEKECTNGRILVFQYVDKTLSIVCDAKTRGLPTHMEIFKGKLLVSIGSSLKLMNWNEESQELVTETAMTQFIMPVFFKTKGDFILVGDLMRSISVWLYRSAENKFDMIASDPFARWPTSAEFIDDDVYALMDDYGNLLFFRRETDPASGDRSDLTEVAAINFSDTVNLIRKGTLLPDTAVTERPFADGALILGTQAGAIMHILSIDENTYQLLKQLCDKLIRNIIPFGRVNPEKYNTVQRHAGSVVPAYGVINGDLIEMITTMSSEEVHELIVDMKDASNNPVTVEQVTRIVEDLARSH
ncbi:DNA damage-binding protein 1-like [Paramacrobiotus metropolitanus]|uniref:DNA damage-binding protein 1-like n=1 Tax=Paramacrobiotus metropolitanus TaxID=2943436 RepID=UPI00244571DC|nr:DNA damage-binding protein 1-like [Paramacrobiotus metropolitanus]